MPRRGLRALARGCQRGNDWPARGLDSPHYNAEVETPNLRTIVANGLDLAVWDWPGADPPILFAHATGFHGRCWDQVIRHFPGRRSIAVDFRGHGRSAKPEPPYEWDAFAGDLAIVANDLHMKAAIGVGHSMGGHSVTAAAALRPETFSALLLIDPTIFPPGYYGRRNASADFIRRRRNAWQSPEEMIESFRARRPFASWQPEVLRDYCRFGLLPHGTEFVLACPPAVEASIYEHSNTPRANLYDVIPSITQPVTVVRAGTPWTPGALNLGASPTAPDLAAKFQHGTDRLLADRDHYIPMQSPALVAEAIAELISDRTARRGGYVLP
jgi:pimeloyl-ACP methyl ester carboxylesterase